MRSRNRYRPPPEVRRRHRPDGGQATAELAVGLPSLFVVFFLVVWMLGAAATQARCAEAARIGARLAARGESESTIRAWIGQAAPRGAVVQLSHSGDTVGVRVSVRVGGEGVIRVAPTLEVAARAVAPAESPPPPGTGPSPGEAGGQPLPPGPS